MSPTLNQDELPNSCVGIAIVDLLRYKGEDELAYSVEQTYLEERPFLTDEGTHYAVLGRVVHLLMNEEFGCIYYAIGAQAGVSFEAANGDPVLASRITEAYNEEYETGNIRDFTGKVRVQRPSILLIESRVVDGKSIGHCMVHLGGNEFIENGVHTNREFGDLIGMGVLDIYKNSRLNRGIRKLGLSPKDYLEYSVEQIEE